VLLHVTNELCDVLAGKVAAGQDVVEMSEAAMRVTLDVIGSTGYGWVGGWSNSAASYRTGCVGTVQGPDISMSHLHLSGSAVQSAARCCLLPLCALRAVCRYDFKARTYAYCEMFEVRQPAPACRACQRLS